MAASEPTAVIALQETHLNSNHEAFETNIPGYREIRGNRSGRRQGGVSTYILDGLTVTKTSSFTNGFTEAVLTSIKQLNLTIINAYRSPAGNDLHFSEMMDTISQWTENTKQDIALLGDLNLEMGTWTPEQIASLRSKGTKDDNKKGVEMKMKLKLLDFVDSHFITQVVREPTRGSATLDLIFTNSNRRRDIEVVRNIKISDHDSIRLRLVTDAIERQTGGDRQLNTTDLGRYNIDDLNEEG